MKTLIRKGLGVILILSGIWVYLWFTYLQTPADISFTKRLIFLIRINGDNMSSVFFAIEMLVSSFIISAGYSLLRARRFFEAPFLVCFIALAILTSGTQFTAWHTGSMPADRIEIIVIDSRDDFRLALQENRDKKYFYATEPAGGVSMGVIVTNVGAGETSLDGAYSRLRAQARALGADAIVVDPSTEEYNWRFTNCENGRIKTLRAWPVFYKLAEPGYRKQAGASGR